MAKFPIYERRQGLAGGSTGPYASADAFAAPGRALANAGGAIADLGADIWAGEQRIRETQANTWVSKARAETAIDMINAEREAQQAATGGAENFTADVQARYDEYRKAKTAAAPNEYARRAYDQWADSYGVDLTRSAAEFQAKSELAQRGNDFADTMAAHAKFIQADPSQYDRVVARAAADFEAAKAWMTPEQEIKARAATERDFQLARAQTLRDNDPAGFLRDLGIATPATTGEAVNSVVDRIIGAESGGDTNAQNPRSSAAGLGGFIDSTWVATVRKYRPDIARGLSNDQIIELKTSEPALAREMTLRHVEDNAAGLQRSGNAVTPANLYLAHFAGQEGARKVLAVSDDTPVASVLSAEAIKANPEVLGGGKTVGDLKRWTEQKMGGVASSGAVPKVQFIDETSGKIRDKPVQGWVKENLARAAAATDPRIAIKIVSGGQNPLGVGGKRTGSTRHDHGNAADIVLVVDGKPVLPGEDKALYAAFFRNAAANGFTGLGHYAWGVHVGGGAQAVWGPDRTSKTLDPEFAKAAAEGWGNPAKPGKGINVSGNPYYSQLSPDEIVTLRDGAQQRVATQEAAKYSGLRDAMWQMEATGQILSEAQIINSGLRGDDVATLLGKFRSSQDDGRNLTAGWAAFRDGTLSLDSYDTKDRSLVDKMEGSIPEGETLLRDAFAGEVVARTGIVPKGTVSSILQGLESRDPATVAAAARRAARISSIDPAALGKRDNGTKAADAGAAFSHYVDTVGLTEEQAAQRLIDAADPEKAKSRAALLDLKTTKDFFTNTATEANVRDIFDPGLFSGDPKLGTNPATAAAMVGEYRLILEESFIDANGDKTLAKTYAAERFSRRYGTSELTLDGADVVSRLPPEKVYPPAADGTHDYVRAQLIEALKGEGITADEVFLQPDNLTDADFKAGRPARYQVYYRVGDTLELYNLPFFAIPPSDAEIMQGRIEQSRGRRDENMQQLLEGRDREKTLDNYLAGPPVAPASPATPAPASEPKAATDPDVSIPPENMTP